MKQFTVVADENIPLVNEFFSDFGRVLTYPGRNLSVEQVADADVLLVRSVTQVNEALLAGSQVKFVGTCTIGTDHLDKTYLDRQGIAYSSAPGCNANSVVEYVFSALARQKSHWLKASYGIIGCGNVGGHLYRRLKSLGLSCQCYDPFLNTDTIADLTSLESVLSADVICLHTPHTSDGLHPTEHLLGEAELLSLKKGATLINAGRGPAIDNSALLKVMKQRSDLNVVLDVWEPEPQLNPQLLGEVNLGSPHIAGYSFDGKVEGTAMIYRAVCEHLSVRPQHSAASFLPADEIQSLKLDAQSPQEFINRAILSAYDVAADDLKLRQCVGQASSSEALGEGFDQLRKSYPKRREFNSYRIDGVDIDHWYSLQTEKLEAEKKSLNKLLATLGFALGERVEG